MVEILRCPGCGAADTSEADADGSHRCVFCGVRYVVRAANATAAPAAPVSARSTPAMSPNIRAALVAGLFLAALVVLAIARFAPRPGDAASAPPSEPSAATVTVPAPTISETIAPPPEPDATATFVEHGVSPGVDGAYWVLGVVTNTSPWPIEAPRFEIVYLGADGAEVGVSTAYGHGEALAAGASHPVSLLANDPPKHASHRVEVRPKRLTWSPSYADGLTLAEFPTTQDRYGEWQASGTVRNGGSAPAQFVQVLVAAWSAEGTLLGVNRTYAAGEEGLAVGATARYSVRIDTDKRAPARFTTTLSGRH